MSRLLIVRHGQTSWNAEGRYQGSMDIPLNEVGKEQAKQVGESLSHISFVAVYSSHLSRAVETAKLISGKDPITYPSLMEGSFGNLEGQPIESFREKFAHRFAELERLTPKEKLHFKFSPEVESGHEVLQRVLPTLIEIAKKHEGEDVLIVSHGGVIRNIIAHLTEMDWPKIKIKNGDMIPLEYKNESLILAN